MQTVIIRHKVGNFDTWLKGHQDRVDVFKPAVTSFKTFRDESNPNAIVMVLEVHDLDKLMSMMRDPRIQTFKDKHTVIDPIELSLQVKV
jgi:hypothetical protein